MASRKGSISEISDKGLLTVGDVARYTGVGQVTVHRWRREGRLPCSKVGMSWRIWREILKDFVRRGSGSVPSRSKGGYGPFSLCRTA